MTQSGPEMTDKKKAQSAERQKRYRERQKATLQGVAANERKLEAALLEVTNHVIHGLLTKEDRAQEISIALLKLRTDQVHTDQELYEALLRLDALRHAMQATEKPAARYPDGTLKLL